MSPPRFLRLFAGLAVMLLALPGRDALAAGREGHWEESVSQEIAGDLDGALSSVGQFLEGGGDRYLGNLRTAWLWYLKRDYDKAGQYYQKAQKANLKAITPILGSANCLLAGKQVDAAAKAYADVLKKDSNNYTANMALAGILYGKKNYRDATTYFWRLETLYPEDAAAASGLAWCLYLQGNKQKAAALFSRVLTLNSKFPYATEGYKLSTGADPNGKRSD